MTVDDMISRLVSLREADELEHDPEKGHCIEDQLMLDLIIAVHEEEVEARQCVDIFIEYMGTRQLPTRWYA